MPGAVRIAFTREPDYFAGTGLAGAEDVTIVARHAGRVVGMGHCSVTTYHRNGVPWRLGYLGELRVLTDTPESARKVRDGYTFLARLVGSSADGFFTSVAADNHRARRVLELGRRFGLPAYRPLCNLVTLVAPVARRARRATSSDEESEGLHEAELRTFLQHEARGAHLTLAWDAAQWIGLARHGIAPHNFCAVWRDGQIAAAAAVWDQRAFKQTVIDGYDGPLRWTRPVVNAAQSLLSRPRLPADGSVLAQGTLLGATVRGVEDWPRLWRVLQRRAATMGLSWLSLSRDARDPDLPVLRRLLHAREYHTILYDVALRERPSGVDAWWDGRVFRPEVSLL
jgi:hypothetical protein